MSIQFKPISHHINATHHQNPSAKPAWNAGDTITATLLSKSRGSVTLQTDDGFTFDAKARQVKGEVGDNLTFRVMKDKDGLRMQQLFKNDFHAAMKRERGNAELADLASEVKEVTKNIEQVSEDDSERAEEQAEVKDETAKAIARIKRSQGFLSANAGKAAVAALIESGVSLTKITFDMFNRVMHHAEKRPSQDIAPEERSRVKNRPDGDLIVQSLHKQGLPVHDKNIQTLEHTWEHLPKTIDHPTAERLIAGEQPLTIENAYKAAHSVRAKHEQREAIAHWEVPRNMLQSLFQREGIADTEENMKAARFLVSRDLPVDASTVEKVVFLQDFKASKAMVYNQTAECIAADKPIGDISLYEITATAEARHKAETALKVATAANTRHQDLNIDTETLRENLRVLTQRDEANLARYLRMADTGDNVSNVNQIKKIFDTLSDIRPLTANVHMAVMSQKIHFTMQNVHEEVLLGRDSFAKAQAGYEQFATVPSVRHGDSFSQVRAQFAPLLTDMNIAATTENMKAAFILSKNNMDVNEENIAAVKEIDAKINAIANNLHPMIAAQMIKEGMRPLEMHADQLLAYIKQFNINMGEDGSDKIARYIMEMDEDKSIDSDTRKTMIAVYRMLHVIQKDGAAALGLALKQNPETPLSLGSLMELSKYYQSQRKAGTVFDHSVNDAFGHLERVVRPAESIRATLEAAPPGPITYEDIEAERMADIAQPSVLKELLEKDKETPLEELLTREAAKPTNPTTLERLHTFIASQPSLIQFLQKKNIAPTLPNIKSLEKINKSKNALSEAVKEANIPPDDIMDIDLQPLKDGIPPTQLMAQLWAAAGDPTPKVEAARELIALQNGLNNENGFTLPISMNGQLTNLSLYVVNERALHEDGARIFLSLSTDSLGEVQGYFTLNDKGINLSMIAESDETLHRLEEMQDVLITGLTEAGLTIGELAFSVKETATTEASAQHLPQMAPTKASEHEYII